MCQTAKYNLITNIWRIDGKKSMSEGSDCLRSAWNMFRIVCAVCAWMWDDGHVTGSVGTTHVRFATVAQGWQGRIRRSWATTKMNTWDVGQAKQQLVSNETHRLSTTSWHIEYSQMCVYDRIYIYRYIHITFYCTYNVFYISWSAVDKLLQCTKQLSLTHDIIIWFWSDMIHVSIFTMLWYNKHIGMISVM